MKASNIAVALGLALGVSAVYGESHETTCQVTTYFSDAAMQIQVGRASTCPGLQDHAGRVTKFSHTETIEQPDPLVDPGALPCEWPMECTNETATPATHPVATQEHPH